MPKKVRESSLNGLACSESTGWCNYLLENTFPTRFCAARHVHSPHGELVWLIRIPPTEKEQRPQQEGSRPHQAHPLQQLLAMHAQGQGNQEIHHPQHGRVCCYSYDDSHRTLQSLDNPRTDSSFFQVTSLTPRSSPSTPSPRCTSSCSTASLAPSTARSFGTFVPDGGQLCLVECHGGQLACLCTPPTQAAEKNLGGINLHHTTTFAPSNNIR